jgi:transcriptional regulator with XRE-family HTH domain
MHIMENVFSDRLQQRMAIKKISRAELAARTGIDKSLISKYCNGKNIPLQKSLYKIAEVLDEDPNWLIGMESDEVQLTAREKDLMKKYRASPLRIQHIIDALLEDD